MERKMRPISLLLLLCILSTLLGCGADLDQPTVDTTALSSPVSEGLEHATADTVTAPTTSSVTEPSTGPITQPTTAPATEAATAPTQHAHHFSPATCTDPKICDTCGETEGKAAGHIWKDATCTIPQTCKTCGDTKGTATGHDYADGTCRTCGTADTNDGSGPMVWIPTKGGKKYHSHSGCSNMKGPTQVTRSEAISRGFTPCKKCY